MNPDLLIPERHTRTKPSIQGSVCGVTLGECPWGLPCADHSKAQGMSISLSIHLSTYLFVHSTSIYPGLFSMPGNIRHWEAHSGEQRRQYLASWPSYPRGERQTINRETIKMCVRWWRGLWRKTKPEEGAAQDGGVGEGFS